MSDTSEILNTIFLGEVSNVHNYGAFIRIPGRKEQGLVHKSQISSTSVDDASDVLQKGDRVWCKVVAITDDGKISLSMKVVQQGTGKDLDPTGVQIHQDELKRKEKPSHNKKKAIQLGAIFDTTCTKCGTRGHLSKDCFKSPDGKIYELIPEDDPVDNNVSNQSASSIKEENVVKEKSKKRKKDKKLKKIKEIKKERKKSEKKKKKKRKKRKNHSSSEDSSSSDSESSDSSYEKPSKKRKSEESLKSRKKLKTKS